MNVISVVDTRDLVFARFYLSPFSHTRRRPARVDDGYTHNISCCSSAPTAVPNVSPTTPNRDKISFSAVCVSMRVCDVFIYRLIICLYIHGKVQQRGRRESIFEIVRDRFSYRARCIYLLFTLYCYTVLY